MLLIVKKIILTASVASSVIMLNNAHARNNIEIVGSSTVFPFSTVVAETFGQKTGFPTPKVESTGSGGGMKLFCKGNGVNTPDITNSSRRIKVSELALCHSNGVTDITELLLGFDGIAIANAKKGPDFNFSLRDLYLGLAAEIPAKAAGQKSNNMIKNPFTHWSQINDSLPNVKIKILGPPPTSGTRDALQELAIESGCKSYALIQNIKKINYKRYKRLCSTMREDGFYVEMGENDNLIISKLANNKNALGIFGFSFLDQNADKVKGARINNQNITFENIASGNYPISRPLYVYIKNSHRDKINGMNEFIKEFVAEDTFGEEGYLVDKGLIPSLELAREKIAKDAKNSINLVL